MDWLLILVLLLPLLGWYFIKAIANDFIAPIHERLDNIEDRLRDVERNVRDLESDRE